MKKKYILIIFSFLFITTIYSQQTITTNIDWSTRNQFMWGPNGSTFFMDQTVPIFNTQNLLPPGSWDLDFTTSVPFLGTVGTIIHAFQSILFAANLRIEGFHTGFVNVDYPVNCNLTFPANQTFNPGQIVTINSNYTVRPGWNLETHFPSTGRIGFDFIYGLNFDVDADIYTGFGSQSTLHMITISVPNDTFALFQINNNNGIASISYPCGLNANLSLQLCHDTIIPITIDLWDEIGLTGTIGVPFVNTEDRLDANKCLYAEGDSDYVHLRLDIIRFIWVISDTSIREILDMLQGTIDLVPNFITVNYDLLNAYLLVTNGMHQKFSFCPEVMAKLTFPTPLEYTVTVPGSSTPISSGNSSIIEFPVDDDLNVKYPCNGFDLMDVGIEYYIKEEPNFCNKTWDQIDINFELDALTFTVNVLNLLNYTIGPLIDFNILIATIPTITWFDQCWNLKGFTPEINLRPDTIVGEATIIPRDTMTTFLSGIDVLCYGASSGSIIINVVNGTPPFSYQWSRASNIIRNVSSNNRADTLTVVSEGFYTVTVTDQSGCTSTRSIQINENPEILVSHNVTDVRCVGDNTGSIALTVSGGTPGYTYYWMPTGQTTQTAVNLYHGSYDVTITDYVGCEKIDSNIVVIELFPLPPAYFIPDVYVGCQPLIVHFTETSPNIGQTYFWDFGDGYNDSIKNPMHIFWNDGYFEVTLTTVSPENCDSIYIFRNIEVYPKPIALFDADPISIKSSIDPTFTINFTNQSTGGDTYNWNFGDTASLVSNTSNLYNPNHSYTPDCDGLYTVTLIVTSDHYCMDTITKQIEIIDDILVFPNVFTPNYDGQNDYLEIVNIEKFPNSKLMIYSRWGKKVFEAKGYKNDWDGNGLGQGTYYYVFDYGTDHPPMNGTITIVSDN